MASDVASRVAWRVSVGGDAPSDTKATKHMMEVHENGKSILWVGEREQAENYAYQLQRWRLQTILEKDD